MNKQNKKYEEKLKKIHDEANALGLSHYFLSEIDKDYEDHCEVFTTGGTKGDIDRDLIYALSKVVREFAEHNQDLARALYEVMREFIDKKAREEVMEEVMEKIGIATIEEVKKMGDPKLVEEIQNIFSK